MHRAFFVIQAQQKRAQRRSVARLAPADHHAVGRALVLDLDPEPLARHIRAVPRLGDHAVEPGAFELLEPVLGCLGVARVRGEEDRLLHALEQLLEAFAALSQRLLAQVGRALSEQVESDEPCRRRLAEHADTRFSWVDPLLQRAEIQPVGPDHHQLAVEHELWLAQGAEGRQQLGEVAGHRPAAPAGQRHLVAVPEDERAEAVPFRLVLPAVSRGNPLLGDGREHRLHVERQRQFQGVYPQVSISCG